MRFGPRHRRFRPAFTLIELLAMVLVIAAVLVTVAACSSEAGKPATKNPTPRDGNAAGAPPNTEANPGQATPAPKRSASAKQKDAANIRLIHQAFVIWAGSNKGSYPTPSQFDRANFTVNGPKPGAPEAHRRVKDNTGNILSMMIYNGNITPETAISTVETSTSVEVCKQFAYSSPKKALSPANALWDPGFAGTPIDPATGSGQPESGRYVAGKSNNSYAHSIIQGARASSWSDTLSATEAVLSNRGPRYEGTDDADVGERPAGGWALIQSPAAEGRDSNTLKFYGQPHWTGMVVYNDNHVNYEERVDPVEFVYQSVGTPKSASDNFFVDEKDEAERPAGGWSGGTPRVLASADKRTNNYLRPIAAMTLSSDAKDAAISRTVWRD